MLDKVNKKYIYLLFFSGVFLCLRYIINLNVGIGLADPSHFWYGSWQVLEGNIPIRDYRSYDPTRYYWAAVFMSFFGDGYSVAKLSCYVFYFLGFGLVLYAVNKEIQSNYLLVVYILSSIAYMSVFFKAHEVFTSLSTILVGFLLLRRGDEKYVLIYGIVSGFSATIGKNFGVYIFLSFLLLYLFRTEIKNDSYLKDFSYFVAGNIVGFIPIIIMSILYDGFLVRYVESITVLFSEYSPVIPLSPALPWNLSVGFTSPKEAILSFSRVSSNLLLYVVPATYIIMFLWSAIKLRTKKFNNELLIVVSVIGVSILHHMMVRTDGSHLSQVVHPFLLLILVLSDKMKARVYGKHILASVLFFVTVVGQVIPLASLGMDKMTGMKEAGYSWVTVGSEQFYTRRKKMYNKASEIFKKDSEAWVSPRPGMNTIFRKDIPIRDPYFILSHKPDVQKEMFNKLSRSGTDTIILENYTLGADDPYTIKEANVVFWNKVTSACSARRTDNQFRNAIIFSDCKFSNNGD